VSWPRLDWSDVSCEVAETSPTAEGCCVDGRGAVTGASLAASDMLARRVLRPDMLNEELQTCC
jgi:hypothetical protein